MQVIKGFFAFWYDFIVGDDWTVAVGVVALLIVSGILAHQQLATAAWVIMPAGVLAVLALSLRRAISH
jgi:hypothetical protein